MATAEEGGNTANGASSSYGGGAGGKFRKKPVRRQATPYDRPPTAHRVENDKNSSWLRKLVEPASALISSGAGRFFAPLLRKRLPVPPPLPPTEAEADFSDEDHGAVRDSQDGAQESPGGNCSQPINNSRSNGISELEQLLKQRTFTRSEIVHLRELLQSRAAEVSMEDVAQKNEVTATDYSTHQKFASEILEENKNGANRSSLISTPIVNLKVIEDDNASPAELAKAYMGSRPSKVSPSVLGMRSRVGREDAGLLNSLPSASSSPIMALTKKAPNSIAAPDNCFITPRTRGRSAIYNMARTPYSKVHQISSLKGTGINSNGYAGPSMSSPYLSPMESDENFESQPMSLKRRSSVFDDGVGSVGPIRRIRQKPNLSASRIHQITPGLGIGSHAKQKLPYNGESSHKVSKDVGEDENESVPRSSYSRVPSKSSEVASKILQHLEKMTPKEKSPGSKLVSWREKSPLILTQNMLSGQALRSMEDANSTKLLLDVHDDHKFEDRSNASLVDACDLSTQKHEKKIDPKTHVATFHKRSPVANNDSMVSLKASTSSAGATDYIGKTGAFQPQNKRAFRMSAQEDYFEQDDDAHELAPKPFSEKRTMDASLKESKVAPAAESKLVKPSFRPADQSHLAPISKKTSEVNSSAVTLGEVGNNGSLPASERLKEASQSAAFPPSVSAFDKPKEANNPSLFSFSSAPVEKVDSLPSESIKETEFKIDSSSSVLNVSASSGSQVKNPISDKSSHLNNLFKAGDVNGNGPPPISSSPPLSFSATSNDADQVPKDSASLFPSLISGGNSVPSSTSSVSNGSIFGLKPNPSTSAAPVFKFSSNVDPSTTSILADKKSEMDPSSAGSSSSLSNVAPFSAVSSGSSTVGFGSAVSFSATNNNPQGSPLFANVSKPLVSDAGIGLQGTTSQSVVSSSASSLPTLNVNSSTSLGSTSSSQGFNTSSGFGFTLPASASTSASTSTISAPIPSGGPTISADKFGASSTDGTAVSSASGASQATFSFGFGSNSSSTNAVGSSTASLFGFPANSSSSAPVTNTSSSLSSGTSAVNAFGGSSPAPSSAPNSSSVFGSSWQSTKSPTPSFASSAFTSPFPSTGFSFGATAVSAPSLSAPSVFNNPSTSGSAFSFTAAPPSVLSSPSVSQPVFGNSPRGFGAAASPDQMNAEDSMAEDNVVQTSAAAAPPGFPTFGQQPASSTPPAFGQQPASSTPPAFGQQPPSSTPPAFGQQPPSSTPPAFGQQPGSSTPPAFGQQPGSSTPPAFGFGSSSVAAQPNPFMFGGQQQNQAVAPQQNPSPFQASGSLDQFNAGGSFSLGSGGGDKSGRKIVRINRNKNRKK